MTTFAEGLKERTAKGQLNSASAAERERAEREEREARAENDQAIARMDWLTRNLPKIKGMLNLAADAGKSEVVVDAVREFSLGSVLFSRPDTVQTLARCLHLALDGLYVVGLTNSEERDMGDSAAPCRETVFTYTLAFRW